MKKGDYPYPGRDKIPQFERNNPMVGTREPGRIVLLRRNQPAEDGRTSRITGEETGANLT